LSIDKLPRALAGINGVYPPAWHHFTVGREGHEHLGMSLGGMGPTTFLMFRDRELVWMARLPRALKRASQTSVDADNLMSWALSCSGPTIDCDVAVAEWQRAFDVSSHQKPDPGMSILWFVFLSFGRDGSGNGRRFARTLEELGATRLSVGMDSQLARQMLPRPTSVENVDGLTRLTFERVLDAVLWPNPCLVVLARDGRVEQVTSIYKPSAEARKWESHGSADVGVP
jgi:hypothetical protein